MLVLVSHSHAPAWCIFAAPQIRGSERVIGAVGYVGSLMRVCVAWRWQGSAALWVRNAAGWSVTPKPLHAAT